MQTFKFIAAALMVAGVSAGAHAGVVTDTITQTGTITQQKTDFNNVVFSVTNGANSTNFADFNSALGTLQSVTLTLNLNGVETGTLTNNSVETQTFNFSSSSNMALGQAACTLGQNGCTSLGSGPAVLTSSDLFNTGLTLVEATQKYTLGPDGSTSILPQPNAFGSGVVNGVDTYTGANANEFIGTGGFQINATTLSGSSFVGGGGNLSALLATQDGASISLVYTYTTNSTPVPEPASFALLGAGLVGMTMLVRRRRSV